jgi:hypothetical protein
MHKLFLLFFFILIQSVLIAQAIDSSRAENNLNYSNAGLIKGSPVLLKSNNYFSDSDKFSYALINSDNDNENLLYFIVEKTRADSNSYLLIYCANGTMKRYNYLNSDNSDTKKIHVWGNIIDPAGAILAADIFYQPGDSSIEFLVTKKSTTFKPNLSVIQESIDLHFELGIRDESIFMFANLYKGQGVNAANSIESIRVPINFHLTLGLSFLDYFKIDIRTGIMVAFEDFYGYDEGIFLNVYPFKTDFFAAAGIDIMHNSGEEHGTADYSISGGSATFYCLGLGYSVSRHFDIDLMYYIPNDRVFGFNNVIIYETNTWKHFDKIDYGLLAIGVQYSFIF